MADNTDNTGWSGLWNTLSNAVNPPPVHGNSYSGTVQRQAAADVQDQGKQAVANAVQSGNLDQQNLAIGLGNNPVNHAQTIKQLASPVVKQKIKDGSITKDDYIQHDLMAQDSIRAANGQPPMDQNEQAAHAEKAGGFWNQLGLDGKTALLLGAAMAGAVAFKNQPAYNQNFQQNYQAALDRRQQTAMMQAKIQQEQAQQAAQIKAQQEEGMANRASAEKIGAAHDKASNYTADQRVQAVIDRMQGVMDKQARMTPDQLDSTIDNQLIGAGFNQYTDPKKKIVDPNYANAKGKTLALFNAYRNSPKYKEVSDGQLIKAIMDQHITQGQPASGGFLGFGGTKAVPPQYTQ